jgi:hypothetical protein
MARDRRETRAPPEQRATDGVEKVMGSGAAPATWSEDGATATGANARVAARGPSSGAVIFWLILATLAVSGAAIAFGAGGYPVFGLGLGFGFAVGAIPYGLLVLAHASASEMTTPRTGRKRRMTDEEWQRIFGPRTSGPGAWTAQEPPPGAGRSQPDAAPALDEQLAFERLELEPGATLRQVTRAYHRLAHRYHPDLTAGLPEGERMLAEQKMKELNAAYELLRHRLTQVLTA